MKRVYICRCLILFWMCWGVLTGAAMATVGKVPNYKIVIIAEGLVSPASIAFLPSGDLLVAERSGVLRIISNGVMVEKPVSSEQDTVPLRDIALHPEFEKNHWVYLSTNEATFNRILRGTYNHGQVESIVEIYKTDPVDQMQVQPGGRIVFLPDKTLLVTVGDAYKYREEAQNLQSLLGKIIRLNDDGTIPQNNPFIGQETIRSEIWSYGHRQALGIAYDSVGGLVYSNENGPQGGDELNLIIPGKNYGWPISTYGLDYSGAYVSPFTHYQGTEKPLVDWTPSIAPSGLTLCRNCQWPEWEGDIFSGMLKGQHINRTKVKNGVVVEQQIMFQEIGERIRDVRFGPNGALYIVTDSINGRVLKISRDN